MRFATLDMICRRSLLEKGLPIHWYAEYLFHSAAAIRELTKDTLKIINAANIPISGYGSIDLPDDFVDDLAVCIPVAESLQRIPKQDWITPLRINNPTTGEFEPYLNQANNANQDVFAFAGSWGFFWNVNDFAEPTGRFFGAPGSTTSGYKLFKERRQIQLTQDFIGENQSVVLLYISDGQSIDNASQVDMLAFSAVQRYIDWMSSPNAGIDMSPQGSSWYNARRLLRANLNDMTTTDIRQTLRYNYMGAPKS